MDKNNYCVIMAGGVGSRFWPLSRTEKPKQFLDVLGLGKTLIQLTFERFQSIIPKENILIVTNEEYKDLVNEQLPGLKQEQILYEPLRRNTAPCIAYANFKIKTSNPDARIVVAPSDHLIMKEKEFLDVIQKGLDFVSNNNALLTLGIRPSRPETGYGYIQVNGAGEPIIVNQSLRKVKTFTEKPDYDLAKVFYESGDFYWNSGIFIWSLNAVMDAFDNLLPEVNNIFVEGIGKYNTPDEAGFINQVYTNCKSISIDYGVMEKADNVHVLCSDFGWSDLGTWGSLHEKLNKDSDENTIAGDNVLSYDLKNCLVNVPKDKLVVLQGLEDMLVVESDDILLVCKKEDEQRIKQFVNDVKIKMGDKFI